MRFALVTVLVCSCLMSPARAQDHDWSRANELLRQLNATDVPVLVSACEMQTRDETAGIREGDVFALVYQGWSGVLLQVRKRRLRTLARFDYDASGHHELSGMPLNGPDSPPVATLTAHLRGQWFDLMEEVSRRGLRDLGRRFSCAFSARDDSR